MSEVPLTLTPTQSVQDAMATLYNHGITGAPVVNDQRAVVGIVSNYDVRTRISLLVIRYV
jgi:CBS domain-containing protein